MMGTVPRVTHRENRHSVTVSVLENSHFFIKITTVFSFGIPINCDRHCIVYTYRAPTVLQNTHI